ncbi:hypothetical protein L484_008240 [Morus notabilis]|uniref:Uncharacterized protein n=1 Tax=Morus notabilis TaxID=981085 RepID=W9R6I9_9ROSA|nr:hypothetical protein L484_008240 [Morus notabilis]
MERKEEVVMVDLWRERENEEDQRHLRRDYAESFLKFVIGSKASFVIEEEDGAGLEPTVIKAAEEVAKGASWRDLLEPGVKRALIDEGTKIFEKFTKRLLFSSVLVITVCVTRVNGLLGMV